jgi:hypothetical protein
MDGITIHMIVPGAERASVRHSGVFGALNMTGSPFPVAVSSMLRCA